MNKSITKRLIILAQIILVVVITLAILADSTKAIYSKTDSKALTDFPQQPNTLANPSTVVTTSNLSWLISNYPEKFLQVDESNSFIKTLFGYNKQQKSFGYTSSGRHDVRYGLVINNPENSNGVKLDTAYGQDIRYTSTMCIYHAASNSLGEGFQQKIANIIDFDSTGIIKIYKYNVSQTSLNGALVGENDINAAYISSATIDLNNKTIKYENVDGKDNNQVYTFGSEYTAEQNQAMKDNVATFAYLLYCNT